MIPLQEILDPHPARTNESGDGRLHQTRRMRDGPRSHCLSRREESRQSCPRRHALGQRACKLLRESADRRFRSNGPACAIRANARFRWAKLRGFCQRAIADGRVGLPKDHARHHHAWLQRRDQGTGSGLRHQEVHHQRALHRGQPPAPGQTAGAPAAATTRCAPP